MYDLRFGCQTYPWKMGGHSGEVLRMLETAEKAGFQSLEAEIEMLGTYFEEPEALKELLERYQMEFAALVLHQDWTGLGQTEDEKALGKKAIAFVKHFPFAKIMLSHHAGNIPRGEGSVLAKRRKHLITCMEEVAVQAAEEGIICCFHPNSAANSLFRTAEDYENMFQLLETTTIGWAPDAGHMENGGMSALKHMKDHRNLIRHVHFKDRTAQDEWAVMGEGIIDYPEILKFLAETDYHGWIMVEDESPRAAWDSDGVVALDGAYMCKQIGNGFAGGISV